MKRFFTLMSFPALMLASALPALGSEPVFSFDFEDGTSFSTDFSVKNNNSDGYTWEWTKYSTGATPYNYVHCYNWQAADYNDALTTKAAYTLEKGKAYILSLQAWSESSENPESLTLAVGYFTAGNEDNPTRIMSFKPENINKYNGETPRSYETALEVDETGDYYFTFMAIGNQKSGGAALDNITLIDGGSPMTPQPVSSLTATAAEDFSLSSTLAITLPAKTVTGKNLPADGISKVEIYRGTALVQTLTNGLTPGSTINWTDSDAVNGVNRYKVIVYNGDLTSSGVETEVYVGPVTPNAPETVKAAKADGGKINISWSDAQGSVEGQPLKTEKITYNLYRKVNDGTPLSIASGITDTEYEDTYPVEETATLVYAVETVYSGRKSAQTSSNSIKVGAYTLPFEESFADAILPDDWQITTSDTSTWSTKEWVVASKMNSAPNAESYDEDGGLLTYNSYSASRNYWSQAITPEIRLNGATAPVLEFQFYHSTNSSSSNDRVVIEVSKDGGEFEEMDMEPVKRYDGSTGWKLHQFPLAAYGDASAIRISFKAISDYGADMAIDAVRVYAASSNDLEAGAIEAVTEVDCGQDVEFKFTVNNIAFGNVSGADYSVNAYLGGELLTTIAGQDVEAMKSVDLTFNVSTHAGHVEAGVPVYAEIVYADDENTANNISDEITVNVNSYGGDGISNLAGVVEGSTLRLTWTPISIEDYDRMESGISFDDEETIITKEAYDADNSIAWPSVFIASDGSEWKNIDMDGLSVPQQYSMPAGKRGFMFSSWDNTGNSSHKDYSGERTHGMLVAAAPAPGEGAASDYLVSPLLPGRGNHVLEFVAKSYSSACTADFMVEYTTSSEFTSEDMEDKFMPVGAPVHINNNYQEGGKWNTYSYMIPSDAKYVAIHFVGESKVGYDYWGDREDVPSVLCVDDINLVSEPISKPTYNVYYREVAGATDEPTTYSNTSYVKAPQKHNDVPVEDAEYVLTVPSVATDFHVSTVYPQGETSLSEPYRLDVMSGVENVIYESAVSIKAEGRTLRAFRNGEEIVLSVFASDGTTLAIDVKAFTAGAPGAYIVKAGDKAMTVVVR